MGPVEPDGPARQTSPKNTKISAFDPGARSCSNVQVGSLCLIDIDRYRSSPNKSARKVQRRSVINERQLVHQWNNRVNSRPLSVCFLFGTHSQPEEQ